MSNIIIPPEFEDYKEIMEMGAKKHGANNWLKADGDKSSFKQMHDSMFHHLAESFAAGTYYGPLERKDAESGLDPLLHLATRALMCYTRIKRDIIHKDDK